MGPLAPGPVAPGPAGGSPREDTPLPSSVTLSDSDPFLGDLAEAWQ